MTLTPVGPFEGCPAVWCPLSRPSAAGGAARAENIERESDGEEVVDDVGEDTFLVDDDDDDDDYDDDLIRTPNKAKIATSVTARTKKRVPTVAAALVRHIHGNEKLNPAHDDQ